MNAAAEAARRKIKRAEGLLRDAAKLLAAHTDDDVLGVVHVHDAATVDAARQLIEVGAGHHGAVDVVVVARPTRRSTPTTAPDGAKENQNGTTNQDSRGRREARY